MKFKGGRPITHLGISSSFIPNSIPEPKVLIYVTEGSKEEIIYLKGVIKSLTENDSQFNKTIICVNEEIDESIMPGKLQQSHPLSRLELLNDFLSLKYSKRPQSLTLWLICDRDNGSLTNNQYDKLVQDATQNQVNLIISNPAFQIWLFFHFYSWLREGIYEDGLTCKDRIRLLEKMISKKVRGYCHGSLNFSYFTINISKAIINSQKYTTNIIQLKHDFGTNFNEIIQAISK